MSATQATSNSASDPGSILNAMLKILPPEGMDTLLILYNKISQQEYFHDQL